MIYITGDTHGTLDFDKLEIYFRKRYISEKDYLIILGDAGICWSKEDLKEMINRYGSLGLTVFFIDGNHENFDMLNSCPIIKRNNAKMHFIDENIYHIIRGEILVINGLKFLCIGGAESIDKHLRRQGISWWKEESIKEIETDDALLNAAVCDFKVDYVLSHCSPSNIHVNELGFNASISNEQLDRINKYITFDKWYFGHYHIDKQFNDKYRCFYYDILEIPVMDEGKSKITFRELYGASTYNHYKDYPYLKNCDTARTVKITAEDLPEWYYENFAYFPRYYCLKDVVDVAYRGSPFDNHINKDSRIYLSYDKKIKKDKDYSPIDESGLYDTWRCDLISFVAGLEKYSPHLDLIKLKEKINLTYDQYNRNLTNHHGHVGKRAYPEIQTEIIKDIKYQVLEGDAVLCNFFDFDTAKEYAELYITENLKIKNCRMLKMSDDHLQYDTSHNMNIWVKVVPKEAKS